MMNFRVEGLDELIEQLKADGVRVDENRMEESYGKFAWIYDPDGNKVELWEPAAE
jgi:predicted enzyme related to lactoylglutathione lyase